MSTFNLLDVRGLLRFLSPSGMSALRLDGYRRLLGNPYVCSSCASPTIAPQRAYSARLLAASRNDSRQHYTLQSRYRSSLLVSGNHQRRYISFTSCRSAQRHGTRQLIPVGPARTRFAPSPTGYIHLGSLRTALFNYLLAKKTGGQFILRIEDTDQKRLVSDAEQRLCDDLKWAGIHWDEGPEVGGAHAPYKQSERSELYRTHASKLIDLAAAYRCFCSANPLVLEDADPSQIATSLGGCQRDCQSIPDRESTQRADEGDRFVVRFKSPAKAPRWVDLVYGNMSTETSTKKALPQRASIDGVVLLKSDGTPTYHLANVVDDHEMEITHVIRGTEWMPSTALHVALYDAFGWTPPSFAHVGLLTDHEQNKLSKRNFDTDVRAMRKQNGILPESLVNFLALLGWRNPQKSDVMNLVTLADTFDLKFTRGNTIVSLDKLWYMQKHHAKARIDAAAAGSEIAPFQELVTLITNEVISRLSKTDMEHISQMMNIDRLITSILLIDRGSYENPKAYVDRNKYFFTEDSRDYVPSTRIFDEGLSIDDVELAVAEFLDTKSIHAALEPISNTANTGAPALWDNLASAAGHCNVILTQICHDRAETALGCAGHDRRDTPPVDKSPQYRAWTKAIHQYIRERLTFGVPSPATGYVMAVLGYKVCRRRLERKGTS